MSGVSTTGVRRFSSARQARIGCNRVGTLGVSVKAYLRFDGDMTRDGPTRELRLSIFEIQAESIHRAYAQVNCLYLPQHLIILSNDENDLEVRSLHISNIETLASSPIPANVFGSIEVGISLCLPTMRPGDRVGVLLRNKARHPVRLAMYMRGQTQ